MRIAVQIPMTREKLAKGKETNTQQQVKFYACSSWSQILVIPELREVTEGTEFKASLGYMYSASKTEQKKKSYMSVIAAFRLKNQGLREGSFLCLGVMWNEQSCRNVIGPKGHGHEAGQDGRLHKALCPHFFCPGCIACLSPRQDS